MLIESWRWARTLAVPVSLAIATPAIGAGIEKFSVYGWQDDAGVEHYTSEPADVPEMYRNRVATLIKDWGPPAPEPEEAKAEDTAQTTQASPTPVAASSDVPQANVTEYVDASQNSSVVPETQVMTQQPVLFDDLLAAGGRPSFTRSERPSSDDFQAAGPIPQGPAGPPAFGAAGHSPFGATGHSPLGAAGHSSVGFAARGR